MTDDILFPSMGLDEDLVLDLRRLNPWWEQKPGPVLPATRRHLVGAIHSRIAKKLSPIVVVRGPRQIGKTTAHLQVIDDLLAEIDPRRIFRLQCDELEGLSRLREPILRVVDWYERAVLRATLNEKAHRDEPCFLFFDEVQNLDRWAAQLKSLVDASTATVVVTGSSALRIEMGRDSLAGRINSIEAGVLSLTEIARFHGIDLGAAFLKGNGCEALSRVEFWRDLVQAAADRGDALARAFAWFSQRGGYPIAHQRADVAWEHVADQLNETVIRRVIQHDLRVGQRGRQRDPQLLEELFRLACRYIGQSPGVTLLAREAQRALSANVGPQRIASYLNFLDNTLLLRVIRPLEIRLKKTKGNAKLCIADHALRASWLQEVIPLEPDRLAQEPHLSDMAGHVAESIIGATLSTIHGLDLNHLPARPGQPEVDYVLTVGTRRIPLEIKYRRLIDPLRDTEGLRTFLETSANNAPFALLATQDDAPAVDDPRIVTLPLPALMMLC
jgi:predicted AAA+ superfamily ATPase